MYPFDGGVDVLKAKVLRAPSTDKLGRVGLAKDIESIVEGHKGNIVVVPDNKSTVVSREVALRSNIRLT